MFTEMVKRFETQTPICFMARATLENVFSIPRLEAIFANNAERQRTNELLFSTVADMMASVVCQIRPSMNAEYRARKDDIGVSINSVYNKLQGIELNVSRAMVRDTASHMAEIIEKTKSALPDLLPGYRVKILDGNHLRRTDRRIGELREINAAPLPGHALVVLDPQLKLMIDVVLCEDGHAQERSLLPQVLETVEPRDVWIEDRNFCTTGFLFGIASQRAYYIVRQHAGNLRWDLTGRQKRVGKTDTGVVYEQKMRVYDAESNPHVIRRITVKLSEATRDGDTVIHILTNLPRKIRAVRIAELYRKRWTIETAFQELAENLHSEINTLGYPHAALFGFCMGLVSSNVLSVVKAALRAAHGQEEGEAFSTYYMADEIAGTYRGMMVAIPAAYWQERFGELTAAQMAQALVRLAKTVSLSKYRKNKWTPKAKSKKKMNKRKRQHVSTARILEQRKQKNKAATA